MSVIYFFFFCFCSIAAFLFLVRLGCAPFSTRISDQMRKQPLLHGIWAVFAFMGALVIFGIVHPEFWPPVSIERRGQRKQVEERAIKAGGWEAIRRGCEALVKEHPEGLRWFPPSFGVQVYPDPTKHPNVYYRTNVDYGTLPEAVAALQPREITFYPPNAFPQSQARSNLTLVRIKLFGLHSSGGHSTPYYGLEIPCGSTAAEYEPETTPRGALGSGHWVYRRITNGVFEVHR